MKYFTHPNGIFEIKIPLEWCYKNDIAGYEHKSPFSFELHNDSCGCFQLSCYHKSEKEFSENLSNHKYNEDCLTFIEKELPDKDCKIFLWATVVEEYFFMAKYVCQPRRENIDQIKEELIKVKKSLDTLMCLSEDRRPFAMSIDRFEKFNSSLAASFDLKESALKSKCFIQHIIICANQIDAYLRLCIVLRLQILEGSQLFKLKYLYQGEEDKIIMEKQIYEEAKTSKIIDEKLHQELYNLYNLRNKVVHRYIITDIKTFELLKVCLDYEIKSEEIRLILAKIEEEQFEKKVGYYCSKNPHRKFSENRIKELHSLVNEKHFYSDYHRDI